MDCYHCPHAAAIARGDYADSSWQDTPCFGCGSDDSLLPYREAGQLDERLVKDGRPGPAAPGRKRKDPPPPAATTSDKPASSPAKTEKVA